MSLLKLPKNYLSFFFLMLLAYLSLWYEYIHTFNFWGYMGFDQDFIPLRSIVSWLLFIICTHLILTMREMFLRHSSFLICLYGYPIHDLFNINPSINFSAIKWVINTNSMFLLIFLYKNKTKPVTIGGNFSNFYIYFFYLSP